MQGTLCCSKPLQHMTLTFPEFSEIREVSVKTWFVDAISSVNTVNYV